MNNKGLCVLEEVCLPPVMRVMTNRTQLCCESRTVDLV